MSQTKGTPSELTELSELCVRMGKVKQELALLEDAVKFKKEELRELTDEQIPAFMTEIGWSRATLADGREVKIHPVVRGHISKERSEQALQWLRNNDAGDLIKNDVTVSFGRGEETEALLYKQQAEGDGRKVKHREHVHPMTLNKFIRERMERADPLDRELLGVFVGSTTKISND